MTSPTPKPLRVLPSSPAALPVAAPALADGAPVLQGQGAPRLRADAQRNQRRVLDAARRVIEQVGAEALTMDAVAAEAGVGKGTVFRRFGDRGSLLHALLDDEERQLQDRVLRGPPPLGPGALPLERLIAYGDVRLDHLARHGELLSAAESRGGPLPAGSTHPVEVAARLHVAHLLRSAGHPPESAAVLAAALLGFLCAARVHELRTVEGHSHAALLAAWTALATGAVGAAP